MFSVFQSRWSFAILIALAIIPPVAFLTAIPWLKQQNDGLVLFAGLLASFSVISASMILSVLKDRRADEWTRAGSRFSVHWGFALGGIIVTFLIALPGFQTFITAILSELTGSQADEKLVMLSFTGGFMACIFAQLIASIGLGAAWRFWMSRGA